MSKLLLRHQSAGDLDLDKGLDQDLELNLDPHLDLDQDLDQDPELNLDPHLDLDLEFNLDQDLNLDLWISGRRRCC